MVKNYLSMPIFQISGKVTYSKNPLAFGIIVLIVRINVSYPTLGDER